MLAAKLLSSLSGAAEEKLYVDDVFSAYTYTGNGATQTINNGIDLSGKGGMVWCKNRSVAQVASINDTVRGALNDLFPSLTNASFGTTYGLSSFNSNGFSLNGPTTVFNSNLDQFISWSFRKAPKFFDVVTYVGDGTLVRDIPHSLGIKPGMVIVKNCSASTGWATCHMSGTDQYLLLNTTDSANATPTITYGIPYGISTNATTFCVASNVANVLNVNQIGNTYVAYLFAHDPSVDGMIQCGAFTTNGSGLATVNLGWEPQYVMVKATSASGDWEMLDQSRSWCVGALNDAILKANTPSVESVTSRGEPNASGFVWQGALSTTYAYMAIRRPNKPPTVGTQVYNAIARTGTGAAVVVTGLGFAPDLVVAKSRNNTQNPWWFDRLRGSNRGMTTADTAGESTSTNTLMSFDMGGFTLGDSQPNAASYTYINHAFKRAPGVFDIVCYTGTGVAHTEAHGLGVAPELMIIKNRTQGMLWGVYSASTGNTQYMALNAVNIPSSSNNFWNNTTPSTSTFSISTSIFTNTPSDAYVAYLFATLAGVSKVGSYTGDGTTGKVINCGFSTGARFVMIKRTSAAGDWFVWDTTRGVVASTDPHLSLNTNAVEVTTDDSIDPDNSGFIVNQLAATNINVNAASYIFLAFS